MNDTPAQVHANPTRRRWLYALLSVAAVVGVGAGVTYYLYSLSFESTDDAFIDGHIVPVSARVSGYVAKVHVTDNQWVNQGDLLAELDPSDYEARSAASEAAVVAARAAITTAESQQTKAQAQKVATEAAVEQARADVLAAEARQQRAKTHSQRLQELVPEHAASQDSLEEALAAERVAEADVAAMRQKVNAQEAAVKQMQAAVAAAGSGVRQAEAEAGAALKPRPSRPG